MRDDGTMTTGIAEARGASGAGAIAGITTSTSTEAVVLASTVVTLFRASTVTFQTALEAEVDTIPHGQAMTTNATKDVTRLVTTIKTSVPLLPPSRSYSHS